MNAKILRIVLSVLMAALLGGLVGGAWWGSEFLASAVRDSDHKRIDAQVSATELQQLKQLKTQLATQADLIDRVHSIAGSTNLYRYQDQVIEDISSYAKRYNMRIANFDFVTSTKAASTKTPFNITIGGQVDYRSFLMFLRDIETNLTKIQVTSLSLNPDKNPAYISNPTLGLEVYIKK